MHGMILTELRRYVEHKHGPGTWGKLLERTDLEGRIYLASGIYPDADAMALVSAASALTVQTSASVLEEFGIFLVPGLMKLHGHMLRPEWKTLDVIENSECTMHRVVRVDHRGAHPPHLTAERLSSEEVRVLYTSPRRMCALAIGIGKGLARHFFDEILVTQPVCMHNGADHCEILFQKQKLRTLVIPTGKTYAGS